MRIGELAKMAACDVQTVRYYEKEGLLPAPPRGAGGYRQYRTEDGERLRFVRRCRELGMSLREVRVLLDFRDQPEQACGEVNSIIDRHVAQIECQMKALSDLRASLANLRQQCGDSRQAKDCGILLMLDEGGKPRR